MAFVVTEACIACRYGECVSVCPQQAFHEGPNFVVINPVNCANCGLCEMVCPVQAIRADYALAPAERDYIALNASLAKLWPAARPTTALSGADEAAFHSNKRDRLIAPGHS